MLMLMVVLGLMDVHADVYNALHRPQPSQDALGLTPDFICLNHRSTAELQIRTESSEKAKK